MYVIMWVQLDFMAESNPSTLVRMAEATIALSEAMRTITRAWFSPKVQAGTNTIILQVAASW